MTWTEPSFIATGVTKYDVAYLTPRSCTSDEFDEDLATIAAETVGDMSMNITGLEPETCYLLSVRAYSLKGPGEWSVALTVTPPTDGAYCRHNSCTYACLM